MDESDENSSLGKSDSKEDLNSSLRVLRYRAVRKFPSNSNIPFKTCNGEAINEYMKEETNIKNGDASEGCGGEDELEDDDYVYDEDSDESVETTAKKLKLSEDAKTLQNIFMTEDFVDFLCYRKFKEPEDANEQRKIVSEFFKEENSQVASNFEVANGISKSVMESNAKSKPPVKEEQLLSVSFKSSNSVESVEKKTKKNFSIKGDKNSHLSVIKKSARNKEGDDPSSLKSRLRPSTKALTAATDMEQFLNIKRKFSQSFHLSSSEGSCGKEVISSFCHTADNKKKLNVGQAKYSLVEGSLALKFIATLSATPADFSDIQTFIAHLISSQTQPAFLIQPPLSFKIECNDSQHVRFSTHNQYVHRFCNRWGRNSVKLACILYFLDSQETGFASHPLAGGVEMDLVSLSDAICKYGGLQKVIDDVLWSDVIKSIKVPKMTRDKISRFYEVYCRYLLPFDTLSQKEKLKLEKKVLNCSNSACCDDLCVSKGRCRTLSELYDVACNIASMFDLDEANSDEVLSTYWKIVQDADPHVTVHTGFIKPLDMLQRRSSARNKSTLSSHLRCCSNVSCPILRDEGVLDGRLEVEMMFSTRCWTTDRHGRGTISYNHTGADIIWYFVDAKEEDELKKALKELVPDLVNISLKYWLPPNTVMIHPDKLMQHGVPVWQVIQHPGQLIIVPPDVFFSSVSCGYSISEHIHFLPQEWLPAASKTFTNLHDDSLEAMFSLERFVFLMIFNECYHQSGHHSSKSHLSTNQLSQYLFLLEKFVSKELKLRKALADLGVKRRLERLLVGEEEDTERWIGRILKYEMGICHVSKDFCFFSVVKDMQNSTEFCLECAVKQLLKRKTSSSYELVINFTQSELSEVVLKARNLQKL